jgi:plasmid stabilization system protein ParE
MTGYALHPEARFDLDEIWEFIRADNLDAADRMIAEILAAIAALVPFPARSGPSPAGPRLTAFALHSGA